MGDTAKNQPSSVELLQHTAAAMACSKSLDRQPAALNALAAAFSAAALAKSLQASETRDVAKKIPCSFKGAPVPKFCCFCGGSTKETFRFCQFCGANLERR